MSNRLPSCDIPMPLYVQYFLSLPRSGIIDIEERDYPEWMIQWIEDCEAIVLGNEVLYNAYDVSRSVREEINQCITKDYLVLHREETLIRWKEHRIMDMYMGMPEEAWRIHIAFIECGLVLAYFCCSEEMIARIQDRILQQERRITQSLQRL